jgi:amidophosphoribosyltransferase
MVRDVFRTRNMRALVGLFRHRAYARTHGGSAGRQPNRSRSTSNSPFGIVLGHNGNLTNSEQLKVELFKQDMRHVNTNSDSEVLLNVLAHELQENATNYRLDPATIFAAVSGVYRRCRGAYAVVAMIAGYGLLAFRDAFGIRPLVIGRVETDRGYEYMIASESVALDSLGFQVVRDVGPGEAIFIDQDGVLQQCVPNAT